MDIVEKIKVWHRGKYVPPPPGRISIGRREQPFLAKCADDLGRFWMKNWKWLLMFLVPVIAIFLSLR